MEAAERFIAVTGSMRSGTSLLGHLVQQSADGGRAHPDIAFENDESRVVADFFSAFRGVLVDGSIGYGDTNIDYSVTDEMLDALEIMGAVREDRIAELRRRLTGWIAEHAPQGPPPRLYGLKRTSLNYEIGLLDMLFGDVRLIFTVRDPRDVLLSHARRLDTDLVSGNALLILAYILSNHAMIRHLETLKRSALIVPYERLCRQPAACVGEVLDFVGVDRARYDFDSLAGTDIPSNSSFGSTRGSGFVNGKGISSESIGRYREVLDDVLIRLVEFLCADVMRAYGYSFSSTEDPDAWDPAFAPLISHMAKRCKRLHISLKAVEDRLQVVGAPLEPMN